MTINDHNKESDFVLMSLVAFFLLSIHKQTASKLLYDVFYITINRKMNK